MGLFQHPVKL